MTLVTLFRLLVVASPVSALVGVALPYAMAAHLSQDWRDILAWNGDGAWFPDVSDVWPTHRHLGAVVLVVCITIVAVALVTQVGLFLFWRFARPLALGLTVAGELLVLTFGLSIHLPVEQICYDISLLCEGAILALAYFSPLRERFHTPVVST